MVAQHYRWDFIGLSTDQKPTPATSEKVVDGSTFYCSDNSKLYVFYKNQWYERKPLGGGGGGGTSDFDDLTNRPKYNGTAMTGETDILSEIVVLTDDDVTDYLVDRSGTDMIAVWLLPTGVYMLSKDISYDVALDNVDMTIGISELPIIRVLNTGELDDKSITVSAINGAYYGYECHADGELSSAIVYNIPPFTGTDGVDNGVEGIVPAPTTSDAGKFLKSDGTWDTAGGGDTVYSTITTSNKANGGAVYIGNLDATQVEQPDPTSTDEHYRYFWGLPFLNTTIPSQHSVNIMGTASEYSVVIGEEATSPSPIGTYGTAIGYGATVRSQYGVAIGSSAYLDTNLAHSVALGDRALPTRAGEVNVGQILGQGYNNTNYRVIGGVHDGQNNHDCATVAQGNTLSTSAPTTSTEGVLGQLWTDTTNMHTYQCTAISGSTYTWTQRW